MKKYSFTIHGNRYDVQIDSVEDDLAKVNVNGTDYEVEIHEEKKKSTKTPRLVRPAAVPSASEKTARTAPPDAAKGTGKVLSPLPGTVLELKVKQGDTVSRGQVLMIMEAMKMENEIRTDMAGVIQKLHVAQGESVLEGALLVEVGSE